MNHLFGLKKSFLIWWTSSDTKHSLFAFLAYEIFGIELKTAIVICLALASSSIDIVLKLLNELGEIDKNYGRKVLGVLLFQDIAVIPILLIVLSLVLQTSLFNLYL